MRLLTASLLLMALALLGAGAQTPPPPPAPPPADTPTAPVATLTISPTERRYFQLGTSLTNAVFAYAKLANQVTAITKTKSDTATQIQKIALLSPLALKNRQAALTALTESLTLMQQLHAPLPATLPVTHAIEHLQKPLQLTADAKALQPYSPDAAHTLAALSEFQFLSSLPDSPPVKHWLNGSVSGINQTWYAEGLITALSQIAATEQMPGLLPPVAELASDLRGLSDWLTLRLPPTPTPAQAALKSSLNAFLKQAALTGKSKGHLSLAQLQTLGQLSQRIQAQVSAQE